MADAAPPAVAQDPPPEQNLTRWLGVISVFVAPTTIITALCFYFGYVSTRAELAHFGIDSDALGYSSSDYVLKSVSVLYPPLVALLSLWAAGLWAGVYARRLLRQGRHTQALLRGAWGLIAVGALVLLRGLLGVVWPDVADPAGGAALTPIALAVGIGAIALGVWISRGLRGDGPRRTTTNAERATWGIGVAIVLLAMFWMANIFATADGVDRADGTAAKLWTKETTLTLYTDYPLDAPKELIAEEPLEGSAGPIYKYQCFRSLAVKGDRWVLVPARWTPEFGYAVIVDLGTTARLSITRLKGIGDGPAADWDGPWLCPELAPVQ